MLNFDGSAICNPGPEIVLRLLFSHSRVQLVCIVYEAELKAMGTDLQDIARLCLG